MKKSALVVLDNDTPITTSRIVAEQFGKNHAHVMRDIRDIIGQIGDESKIGSMFNETTYADKYGREKPMYTMTRTMRFVDNSSCPTEGIPMRKIKAKPLKPTVLKPPSDTPVILVADVFAYHRLMQERRDQYEWNLGLTRLRNRLNGLPVEPEPNYIAEVARDL